MFSSKTYKIIFLFMLICMFAYVIMRGIVQLAVGQKDIANQEVLTGFLTQLYYSAIGHLAYFVIINLTSVTGLIWAKKRMDRSAISAFKTTTILIVTVTIVFYTKAFFNSWQ